MPRITLTLAAVLSMAFTQLIAQDFQRGLTAFDAGNYATALREWKLLANAGYANAQHNLGLMYRTGKGVAQDYAEAAKWYQLAANQGVARAQEHLGTMYRKGQGVVQDYAEAARLYRLAANQGFVFAQSNLGVMYGTGQGVRQDNVMAYMWFSIAATGGFAPAVKGRNMVADRMTTVGISKAQAMARECMSSDYRNCGY